MKFNKKSRDGKQIFRDMSRKYIMPQVTKAEKQGFSAPDSSWFKGESIDFVRHTLCDKNANIFHYMDWHKVQSLLSDHFSGVQNRRLLIWSLLSAEQYLKENIYN